MHGKQKSLSFCAGILQVRCGDTVLWVVIVYGVFHSIN